MTSTKQLTGTSACLLRDRLRSAWFDKRISTPEITRRLAAMNLPEWLISEILEMESHNKLNRLTCPIEQAMAGAVYVIIIDQIINAQNLV